MSRERPCKVEDLVATGYSEQRYTLNDDYDEDELIEDSGLDRLESIDCANCGESLYSKADAREHIEAQEAPDAK